MKSKFKIKITRKDNAICVETQGTVLEILVGLRYLIKSLITTGNMPSELVAETVVDAIEEAEHGTTKDA